MEAMPNIHHFKVPALTEGEIDFSRFKGKKILIVNTASKCGFTPQYADLEKLYEQYKDKLVVVGFPANDFGGQEPGSNEQISRFCKDRFNIQFPMAAKVSVKGENTTPIYRWLTQAEQNGVMDVDIKWNFTKFLIDESGKLIASFESRISPFDKKIISHL